MPCFINVRRVGIFHKLVIFCLYFCLYLDHCIFCIYVQRYNASLFQFRKIHDKPHSET